jgi:hypothetical protein
MSAALPRYDRATHRASPSVAPHSGTSATHAADETNKDVSTGGAAAEQDIQLDDEECLAMFVSEDFAVARNSGTIPRELERAKCRLIERVLPLGIDFVVSAGLGTACPRASDLIQVQPPGEHVAGAPDDTALRQLVLQCLDCTPRFSSLLILLRFTDADKQRLTNDSVFAKLVQVRRCASISPSIGLTCGCLYSGTLAGAHVSLPSVPDPGGGSVLLFRQGRCCGTAGCHPNRRRARRQVAA